MEREDAQERINELEREIGQLPAGSIARKHINGREYFYHRISRNGKRTESYLDFGKVELLRKDIERRKELEKELRDLRKKMPRERAVKSKPGQHTFSSLVRLGDELRNYASFTTRYRKRECFSAIESYIRSPSGDRVFVLYGLRRTGKTTLMRQAIAEMTDEELVATAFLQASSSMSLSDMNSDLSYLEKNGYRYVFIDEVTEMEDFIEGAALFSDIYAASGMKVVLSGTDSLGFVFASSDQLYDRAIMLHTTFIPYREFDNVLGIHGIDEYIRYGGTMSIGGVNYNSDSSFASKEHIDEYVDSAIARNIQHSLKYYQDGGHFRGLYELYENNELTGAINRCVEDMNHRFTREVLTRTFRSSDLAVSARNLLHDRNFPVDIRKNIDEESVLESFKTMLEILDKEEQKTEITDLHAAEISEYMHLLDLAVDVDVMHLPNSGNVEKRTVISQSGIRWAQSDALIRSLMLDEKFNRLSIEESSYIVNRIRSEIMGRMMEDAILLETKLSYPDKKVFKLQFAVGEFDMVIFDPETLSSSIFEIKHSTERVEAQYRHLVDEEKIRITEHRFGHIEKRSVIYRGDSGIWNGIEYVNVEEYLKTLPSFVRLS